MSAVAISFVVYTVAIAALGIASTRFAKESHADFLLADRGLGPWVAGLSAAASAESGWVTLGLVGFAFKTGVGAFWIVPGTLLAFVFNWFVLGPRLRRASVDQNSLTIVDVIAGRYEARWALWIRLIGIGIVVSMLTAYVASQLNAAGKTFGGTFGWDYSSGVLLGAGIVLVYTVLGGFRAVSWTDVVQSVFMIIAVTVIPLLLVREIGGWGLFWEKLAALEPGFKTGVTQEVWNGGESMTSAIAGKSGLVLFGFFALWLGIPFGNSGQPHSLIRLMSARDDQAVRRGGIICSAWVTLLFSGAVLLGITARVYLVGQVDPDSFDPETVLPFIAQDTNLVHGVLGGVLLAAILAAICSTADSQLLVSASAISHDFLERVCGVELTLKSRKIVERSSLLLIGVVATVIAISDVKSVFTFVLDYGWAGLGAGLGPALIMTLLSKRTTGQGIIAGMLVGVTVAVVWKLSGLSDTIYSMLPAFLSSMATIWIVSKLTRAVSPKE